MKKLIIAIAVLITPLLLYFYGQHDPETPGIFPACPFHSATGLYCPGCGSQRATHDILQGDMLGALDHNPLLLTLLVVVLIEGIRFISHRIRHTKYRSILTYPWFSKTILFTVVIFWIIRNLPWTPFQYLAP